MFIGIDGAIAYNFKRFVVKYPLGSVEAYYPSQRMAISISSEPAMV